MARPHKHDERTHEAVLDAAEALLAEGGPEAVTVRAVAERIGASTRAVYSQFGSMPGLMGALGARGFRMVADLVNSLPTSDDPLADLVEVGVAAFRRFAVDRPHLFRITFHEISEEITRRSDAAPALRDSFEALAVRLQRAVDAGVLPPRPIGEYAFAFHALTSGLAANELSRQPPPVGANFWQVVGEMDMAAIWRMALTAFVTGLAAPAAEPAPGA